MAGENRGAEDLPIVGMRIRMLLVTRRGTEVVQGMDGE